VREAGITGASVVSGGLGLYLGISPSRSGLSISPMGANNSHPFSFHANSIPPFGI
jgi:hypothetical protein